MKLAFEQDREGKGTREWSDFSYNICRGCEHGCLYCYAKAQACRFDPEMRVPGRWARQLLNPNRAELGHEVGRKGIVMFPTTHDITPSFLDQGLTTVKNLLAQNQVLIVSKPHLPVIKTLCRELDQNKLDVLFRFTIGALNAELCAYWEPGAPPPRERIEALAWAFNKGYRTSISIEPMLDHREATIRLVERLDPVVTDTIWIGKMQRVPRKHNAHVEGFAEAVAKVKAQQTDAEILRLVRELGLNPKVRWKDSIKAVIAANRGANEGHS